MAVAVLSCVALVGCSGSSPDEPSTSAAPAPGASNSSDLPGLTPTAGYLDRLDARWQIVLTKYPDAVRPETQIVRYITPEEFGTAIAACLTEEGFTTEALPDGGVRPAAVPEEQAEALEVAAYVCTARYPYHDLYETSLTQDQMALLHAYVTGPLTECLAKQGIDVNLSEAPSLQAFIESYGQPGETAWNPYAFVQETNPSEDEWYQIQSACPQSPPGHYG